MTDSKVALRRSLLKSRRALDPATRRQATQRVITLALRLPQIKPGARIAVYAPFGSELDPTAVVRAARRRGIRVYVPVVMHLARRRMRFVPWSDAIRPGIERTPGELFRLPWIATRWLDLILCPVVGIDARGYRLGMGAGFFDRALTYRRHQQHWRGPRLIALAFEMQRIPTVGPQSFDAKLDGVITERGLHLFAQEAP